MEPAEVIAVEAYCSFYHVEPDFLKLLEEHGLLKISHRQSERFIDGEDLPALEKYSRMYYELNINVPGIDALREMLERIKALQTEIALIKERLHLYESIAGGREEHSGL
jgi:chaperone modulatory protein CbpM